MKKKYFHELWLDDIIRDMKRKNDGKPMKLIRMLATFKMHDALIDMKCGNNEDKKISDFVYKELEYKRAEEKEELYKRVKQILGGEKTAGRYSLEDIGKVLSITRERVRQISDSILKVSKDGDTRSGLLAHPIVARRLRDVQKD